jgi:hypothetical protein
MRNVVFVGAAMTLFWAWQPATAQQTGQAQSNQELRQAIGQLETIQRALKAVDHDYQGYRGAGMKEIRFATEQLRNGLKFRAGKITAADVNTPLPTAKFGPVPLKPNDPLPQLASDDVLRQSISQIRAVEKALDSVAHDYGGYKALAGKSLHLSIRHLEHALKVKHSPGQQGT